MIHGSIHIWVTNHLGEISRHLFWCLPQVFAYYPPLTINSLHLYRNHMMTKFAFFSNRAERWKRIWLPYGGILMSAPALITLSSLAIPLWSCLL